MLPQIDTCQNEMSKDKCQLVVCDTGNFHITIIACNITRYDIYRDIQLITQLVHLHLYRWMALMYLDMKSPCNTVWKIASIQHCSTKVTLCSDILDAFSLKSILGVISRYKDSISYHDIESYIVILRYIQYIAHHYCLQYTLMHVFKLIPASNG